MALGLALAAWYDIAMTNNTTPQTTTDLDRLIDYLEKQLASREESLTRRNRFIADSENYQYIEDLDSYVLESAVLSAKASGIHFALQEAKAIAEGH